MDTVYKFTFIALVLVGTSGSAYAEDNTECDSKKYLCINSIKGSGKACKMKRKDKKKPKNWSFQFSNKPGKQHVKALFDEFYVAGQSDDDKERKKRLRNHCKLTFDVSIPTNRYAVILNTTVSGKYLIKGDETTGTLKHNLTVPGKSFDFVDLINHTGDMDEPADIDPQESTTEWDSKWQDSPCGASSYKFNYLIKMDLKDGASDSEGKKESYIEVSKASSHFVKIRYGLVKCDPNLD